MKMPSSNPIPITVDPETLVVEQYRKDHPDVKRVSGEGYMHRCGCGHREGHHIRVNGGGCIHCDCTGFDHHVPQLCFIMTRKPDGSRGCAST